MAQDVTSSYAVLKGDDSVSSERPWRFDKEATGGGIVIDGVSTSLTYPNRRLIRSLIDRN